MERPALSELRGGSSVEPSGRRPRTRGAIVGAALLAALAAGACSRDPVPERGEGPASARLVDHLEERTVPAASPRPGG